MDKDEIYYLITDLLEKLVATPRTSGNEQEATDIIQRFVEDICHDRCRIERIGNNLILKQTEFDKAKPTILLNSHIDTVKPTDGWTTNPFTPVLDIENDRLIGIGSNDAGASLVTLLGTFIFFVLNSETPSTYNLIYLASCEEEKSGRNGIEMVIPQLNDIDFAIVGEPTGMRPAVAEKGLMVLDITVHGISGHAAREEGVNAIYKALPIISALRSLRFPIVSEWLGPVKISVTQINAGTQHNVVPSLCEIVADVRTTDCYDNITTLEIIKESLPEDCDIKPRSTRLNPSHISLDNPVVQKLIMLGKEPFGSPTLSDQALMPWPSVKVGPGESSRSHTANEYIHFSELREALELYISILI